MRPSIWLAVAFLLACGTKTPDSAWPDFGGVDAYAVEAQPILSDRCANPSCHGQADRPLALYAPLRYRRNPEWLYLDAPLTETETEQNYQQVTAFLIGIESANQSRLLTKPRGLHAGVRVFADPADSHARQLETWAQWALEQSRP